MNAYGLLLCFIRGTAIIAPRDAEGWDLIIPTLIDKAKGLKPSNMTAIIIRAERRKKASAGAMRGLGLGSLGDGERGFSGNSTSGEDESEGRPYIAIVMELATSMPSTLLQKKDKKKADMRDDNRSWQFYHIPESPECRSSSSRGQHAKYGIMLYGVDVALYPFMDNTYSKNKVERLLANDELFGTHSRNSRGSLTAVALQLPFLEEDVLSANVGDGVKPYYSTLEERGVISDTG